MGKRRFGIRVGRRRRGLPAFVIAVVAASLVIAGSPVVREAAAQPGAVWAQIGADIDGDDSYFNAGHAVAMSSDGSRMIVGMPGPRSTDGIGRARVFELDGGSWVQVGADIESDASAYEFGSSVAMSADGERVVIGSIRAGDSSGHARIFEWSGSSWIQLGEAINGTPDIGFSGFTSAMSNDGSRVVIGAPVWPVTSLENGGFSGYSWVYEWSGTSWVQQGTAIAGDAAGDLSGFSVDISGDGSRMIVGDVGSDVSGDAAGRVRVFDWTGVAWLQTGADIPGPVVGGRSGYGVAVSTDGSRVIVGTPINEAGGTEPGQARVFDLSGGQWELVGAAIEGMAVDELAGFSVDLNADGSRVIVGSPGHDSILGRARVFDWSGSSWDQVGPDLEGEADYDAFGFAVSISEGGDRIVVGTPYNDGNGIDSGHVRAFDLIG